MANNLSHYDNKNNNSYLKNRPRPSSGDGVEAADILKALEKTFGAYTASAGDKAAEVAPEGYFARWYWAFRSEFNKPRDLLGLLLLYGLFIVAVALVVAIVFSVFTYRAS